MNSIISNLLDLNDDDKKRAELKRKEEKRNINSYITRHNISLYRTSNMNNLGLNSSLCKCLLGTLNEKDERDSNYKKIKKIAKGWQFTTIDWYAIQDFMRAYNCSKTDVVTFALRYYLPSSLYDNSAIQLINEYYPNENLNLNTLSNQIYKFDTIDDYNAINNKKIVTVNSNYEKPLMSFSLDFLKIDALAAQFFKNLTGFNYNLIIKNAIRSFLLISNYQNAEEVLNILKEQDEKRIY